MRTNDLPLSAGRGANVAFRKVRRADRRGTAAIEAAFILPLLVTILMGVWEVGRMVQVCQVLDNAAREGCRLAAGGYVNGTAVTSASVTTEVQDYLTSAGFPSAAVTNVQVTLTNLSSNTWTDPYGAQPNDPFSLTVTVPSGTAFDSMRWNLLKRITSIGSLTATVYWQSENNSQVTVSTTLPY